MLRADGLTVVSGIASFDASSIRTLATRSPAAQPRPQPLLKRVRTRLPLVIDEFDTTPAELSSIAPGAVVRLDNRTLSQRAARLVVPAGYVRLVVDVSGVQGKVVGLISNPIGGDAMSEVHPPADTAPAGSQKPDQGVQVGALPVRLMFSAGRLTLPFGALSDIGPGYVFSLEKRLDDHAITMYANDVPIAIGELVTIGDLVGVRVTRMLPKA
jgi:type III secretion system YscQ/HrcQ family protein